MNIILDKKKAFFEHISECALKNPDVKAMENSKGLALSYKEMHERSNALAQKLVDKKSEIIGIYSFADEIYILGLLGIAKSGNAFLPLDVQFPAKRIKEYLTLTNCTTVLISKKAPEERLNELLAELENYSISCIFIDDERAENTPDIQVGPNDPAYVMFTSGSSGKPKAVLGNHKGLAHFLRWEVEEFSLSNSIRTSWLAPITFDVSLRDTLLPLLIGGTLCIPSEEERTIPHLLAEWLVKMRVNLVHCIPTVLRLLTNSLRDNTITLPELEYILIAGEPLYSRDILNFRKYAKALKLECVNIYGPTETTLAKAFYSVPENLDEEENTLLPIGKPISNTSLLILDENRLCDTLEIGEIYIRTPYKTNGYISNEEENKKSFIINPLTNEENDIVYKTGDMGRYLENGTVECLGRRDNQVKIHGVRIEFGEIEFAIKDIEFIQDASVTAFEVNASNEENNDKQKMLIAYVVLKENCNVTSEDANEKIRSILLKLLPIAFVPSMIFPIEKIPYTTSGKVNKRLLPKPDAMFYANLAYTEPKSETEEKLCLIWQELFGREKISTSISFTSFGGDSLRSIKALSLIYNAFGINIPLQHFFEQNTIQELAEYIDRS